MNHREVTAAFGSQSLNDIHPVAHSLRQWCKQPEHGYCQPGTVRAVEKLDHVYHRDEECLSTILYRAVLSYDTVS